MHEALESTFVIAHGSQSKVHVVIGRLKSRWFLGVLGPTMSPSPLGFRGDSRAVIELRWHRLADADSHVGIICRREPLCIHAKYHVHRRSPFLAVAGS